MLNAKIVQLFGTFSLISKEFFNIIILISTSCSYSADVVCSSCRPNIQLKMMIVIC